MNENIIDETTISTQIIDNIFIEPDKTSKILGWNHHQEINDIINIIDNNTDKKIMTTEIIYHIHGLHVFIYKQICIGNMKYVCEPNIQSEEDILSLLKMISPKKYKPPDSKKYKPHDYKKYTPPNFKNNNDSLSFIRKERHDVTDKKKTKHKSDGTRNNHYRYTRIDSFDDNNLIGRPLFRS